MTAVYSAIVTGIVTLAVCLINNYFQQKQIDKKNATTVELIVYRIDELTKKVEKHNQLVERTYKLEQDAAVMEEKLKVANHRIDDIEKGAVHGRTEE